MVHSIEESKRWLALIILCLGELMIVLDTTIVNVALPSIRNDLAFTESALVWVVNAYMLTFGGFLLLGGRLGDLFGQRKLFLLGIILFTGASLACGIANSQTMLIIARGIQGLGGAVVSAVALSLIMSLFTENGERAKAMGIYGFVCAGGGSVGVLLGGVLTSMLSWHWIFLVNLPIGIAVYAVCLRILPPGEPQTDVRHMDIGGALTITASLMLTVYAIVNGHAAGWLSPMTGSLLGASLLLFIAFLVIESRVHRPLVPLRFFRLRNVSIANVIAALWAAAMFAWFFISALYMQLVLGYDAMQVGLAFLPSNLIMA
ncbi:MAG TPA: MFS transporter, partial [Methylophilaceae bacterium]|nr:MFS transporter [Methylophilaceae bacterium]